MNILQAIIDLITKLLGGGNKQPSTGGSGGTGSGGTGTGGTGTTPPAPEWTNIENPLPLPDVDKPMPSVIPIPDLAINTIPQGYDKPAQSWTPEQISAAKPLPFEAV